MLYIMYLISGLWLLSLIVFMIIRYFNNKINDNKLNISTQGFRSWDKAFSKIYHRTESTPYSALKGLTKIYNVDPESKLIDFGAGKGRVSIYLSDKWNIPVTAIEINDLTYTELKENVDIYKDSKVNKNNKEIRLIKEYAENYKIKSDENIFFFFNPFNSEILKKVLDNVVNNSENKEKIRLIFYYPTKDYIECIEGYEDIFVLERKIKPHITIMPTEYIHIYKFK